MLIALSLYALIIYLIFAQFKLLPWNATWKSLVTFLGLIIAVVVVGALNFLAPSGHVAIQGTTIEITPNVSGTVVEVSAVPNSPVKSGDVLFRIGPEPFETEVRRLEAALVDAKAAEQGLETDLETAVAEVARVEAQLRFGFQRRDDIVQLAEHGASTGFQMQEAVSQIEQFQASLDAAKARQRGIEVKIASEIDGVNASVVQAQQVLASARWSLEQTTVVAPADGVVTALTLRPGQRVSMLNSAVVFLPNETLHTTGVFAQSGAHAFEIGSEVLVAMQPLPGTSFTTVVEAVVPGTGEGTLSGATGALPTVSQLTGSDHFAVRLAFPYGLPDHARRLGMSGSATLITEDAGAVELLAKVLFWLRMQFNYL
ncbi:MAG: biotin/lipoyl-binding protein [Roseobacter sp.]